jgi:hypothetical protein
MGLDMYLTGKRYIWESSNDPKEEELAQALSKLPNLGNNGRRVKGVEVEAMYWRKANAIHKWFVDNVQNGEDECREHYVTREQLKELRDLCAKALTDPENAGDYLSPTAGFFFGSTDIDEWYFEAMRATVDGLNECLNMDKAWSFYYCSSW